MSTAIAVTLSPENKKQLDDMMAANGHDRTNLYTLYVYSLEDESFGKTAAKLTLDGGRSSVARRLGKLAERLREQLVERDIACTMLTDYGRAVVRHIAPKFEGEARL